METKEELDKQLREATIREQKARECYNALLSPMEGEEGLTIEATRVREFQAKVEKAKQELKDAMEDRRKILVKRLNLNR